MLRKETLKRLKNIITDKDQIRYSPEDILSYSYDAYIHEYKPDAVIFPLTTDEVTQIMQLASSEMIPVTPRGSGTNLFSGSLAKKGGIVLSLSKMMRILEINHKDRYAVVEPGVLVAELQDHVESLNLFYPPDPGSSSIATIGGTINTNAGGMRGVKYGVTRDYLLGLEVVLPSGEVINTGGYVMKDVTGYDLTHLICGSEGTLGIVTKAILKLLPKPETKRTLLASYPNLEDAGYTVAEIIGSGIIPATLELMDKVIIRAVEEFLPVGFPLDADALLLIDVDGYEDLVIKEAEKISHFCKKFGAREVKISHSEAENERLWTARRSAFGAMARIKPNCIIEDATVPVSYLPEAIKKVVEISEKYFLQVGVLAHAGDGNLHPLFLLDAQNPKEMESLERASEEIFRYAISVGGTLSGEHGIGRAKNRFLTMKLDKKSIEIMKQIKKVFDPLGILNPGSFLEDDYIDFRG